MTGIKPHAGESSPKVAAIEAFVTEGFPLIPLSGKIPTVKNWQKTAPGAHGPARLAAANYGVVLRESDLVVDVDPRSGGDKSIVRLIEKTGPLLSFTVKTGGGGYHIYFRKPEGAAVRGRLKDFPGIDFKTAGGFVVGPGSIHPDSRQEYVAVSGTPKERAEAPAALLALLETQPVIVDPLAPEVESDDAQAKGRFIAYLKERAPLAVEGEGGDLTTYKVACSGRDLGLSAGATLELMGEFWNERCSPPWQERALAAKVAHAFAYAQGKRGAENPAADFTPLEVKEPERLNWTTVGNSGALRKCFHNLLLFFKHPPSGVYKVFGFNQFTGRVEFTNPAPWHEGRLPSFAGVGDHDLTLLKAHLTEKRSFEMTVSDIQEAVNVAAHDNKFHPVREYLESLEWDQAPRLDNWLRDYLGAPDDAYTRAVAAKILCAAVMRVMKPGIKFDHVPVLEGRQGLGKSSVCRILAGEWGTDAPVDPHSRDTIQLMQGHWIIELAELEVTRRSDLQALRAFITRTKDEARLAYGRTVREFPRQSVFIGSINPSADGTYLRDDENRRWWPVQCGDAPFDLAGLKAARNQLFAEAVARCKAGCSLHMDTAELRNLAKGEAAKRHAEHPWTERVAGWLCEVQSKPETRYDFLTARDVFVGALGGSEKSLDRFTASTIAEVMKTLGYSQVRRERHGHYQRGWTVADAASSLGDLA